MPNVARLLAGKRLPDALHLASCTRELRQDRIDQSAVFGQLGTASIGDLVELLTSLGYDRRKTNLFEIGECRIDHAWARCIEALRGFFKRLDDLVAMPRCLFKQSQNYQLQLAGTELAPAEEAAPTKAPAMAK